MGNCTARSNTAAAAGEQTDRAAIDAFVDLLLRDKNVNCRYLPDFLERDIYRNLIRLILGNLTEIVRSVRIKIMNHVITLHIEPDTGDEKNDATEEKTPL